MSQTSYADPAVARPGLIHEKRIVQALVNAEASAAIPFGRFVQYASSGAKICTATTNVLAGVVVHSHDYRRDDIDSTADGPIAGKLMDVMQVGVVSVVCETNVTRFGRPHIRVAGTAADIGKVRSTGVDGETVDGSGLGMFLQDGTAGATVPLLLDMSGLGSWSASNVVGSISFVVGTEAADTIIVTGQLYDASGAAVAAKTVLDLWVSDAALGDTAATPPSGAVTISTGVELQAAIAKVLFKVVTDATGAFAISIVDVGTPTFYVNASVGAVAAASGAVTFA